MARKKTKPLTGNAGDFSGIVLKAAARGDAPAVRHYLKQNPGWLNQEGPHGRTLLWEAAYKGRTELVAELIQLGADVNPMGSYYTPMLVELSAIAVARSAGRNELVELLKQHGATDDLFAASHRGDLVSMDQFLDADPSAANRPSRDVPPHPRMGFHPIHYAVAGQQLGAVKRLVGHGASVGEHLPLLIDWADGNQKMVKYLRGQAKRSPNSSKSASPLSDQPQSQPDVPAIDRPDWLGFPPLVDACRGNHNAPDDPERVRKLLACGACVNIRDHKGKTPLHRASQAGFIKITKLLLKHGAKLETADDKGCTPIFDAALHGRTHAIDLLLNRGANVNHTELRDETPLFFAARGNQADAFSLLLESGCDLMQINKRGQTVEEFIRRSRNISAERRRILDMISAKS